MGENQKSDNLKGCEACPAHSDEGKEKKAVPYIVHESILARMELQLKRLFVLYLVLLILFVGTNAGWIWYESQFEDVVMTQEATTDGGGDAIANGSGTGDIIYGEGKADNQSP